MIPKGSFIEVNDDFKFHYYDEGHGDVVVLLHGSGTGASGHTNFKNNLVILQRKMKFDKFNNPKFKFF